MKAKLRSGSPAWSRQEIALLGTMPGPEVVRRIGRSVMAVRLKRQKLQIEPPLHRLWTTNDVKLLGKAPDRDVARWIRAPHCFSPAAGGAYFARCWHPRMPDLSPNRGRAGRRRWSPQS